MTVFKALFRTQVTYNGPFKEPDMPFLVGLNTSVIEDEGNTMIVKITACDCSICIPNANERVSQEEFDDLKLDILAHPGITELISHPQDDDNKHTYANQDRSHVEEA